MAIAETTLSELCEQLQRHQKQRAACIKSRNMLANRLRAVVASTLGYQGGATEEEERKRLFKEAQDVIDDVMEGEDHEWEDIIEVLHAPIHHLNLLQKEIESSMKRIMKKPPLEPITKWVQQPEQNGVSVLMLAVIIGETGNLSNYDRPSKVWKRLGCAPHTFNGKTHMGASWKSGKYGKLPSDEWTEFGYNPRRRSIAYLVGEGLVKQNYVRDRSFELDHLDADENKTGDSPHELEGNLAGPYRARYLAEKERKSQLPDWTRCPKCNGGEKSKCGNCKSTGKVYMRCHRHAMLVATKQFLKEMWIEWQRVLR